MYLPDLLYGFGAFQFLVFLHSSSTHMDSKKLEQLTVGLVLLLVLLFASSSFRSSRKFFWKCKWKEKKKKKERKKKKKNERKRKNEVKWKKMKENETTKIKGLMHSTCASSLILMQILEKQLKKTWMFVIHLKKLFHQPSKSSKLWNNPNNLSLGIWHLK